MSEYVLQPDWNLELIHLQSQEQTMYTTSSIYTSSCSTFAARKKWMLLEQKKSRKNIFMQCTPFEYTTFMLPSKIYKFILKTQWDKTLVSWVYQISPVWSQTGPSLTMSRLVLFCLLHWVSSDYCLVFRREIDWKGLVGICAYCN